MPKTAKPLSAREVATIKKPGTYFDGHGLALRLAEARELALQARKIRREDKDPLAEKREARQRHRVSAAKTVTFAEAADAYIQSQMAGWRDPRAAPQWRASLRDHALPVIGTL